MLFLILSVAAAFLMYKKTKLLPDNANPMIKKVITLLVSLSLCILVGGIVTEVYYATDLPDISYEEIDVHFKTDISLEQYVNQEPIVLMDKEHNLHHIDIDKAEITFSANDNAAYIKTVKAKGLWKFIVLDQSRTKYSLQFYDSLLRYDW